MKLKKHIKMFSVIGCLLLLIITQSSCEKKEEPVSKEGFYLDTLCDISIYDMKDMTKEKAEKTIDEAYKLVASQENLLSKTRKSSEIYKINHSNGEGVKVSPETLAVIKKGVHYGELSNGLFDITVGKAADLYDFHGENPKVPSNETLAEILPNIDYKNIKIDGDTVTLLNPNSEIDLGGIAKGYIVDRVTRFLEDKGVTSAIVNFGGNVTVIGSKEGNRDFQIGIRKPFGHDDETIGVVSSSNQTLVTSGGYERYFEENGKRYHHILDPKTGYPKDSGLDSVTIIADKHNSADCDALATICFMLGEKKGQELINNLKGYEAIFVSSDGTITQSDNEHNFKSN